MRKPLIAANWKMYKTPTESVAFLEEFLPLVADCTDLDIAIFPTMSSLASVIGRVKSTNVAAGAQTMHWLNEGPYTGQTSPTMLASISCDHVLLGHSERRIYAHETDDMVNWKLKAALAHGLVPMVCVGETQEKRSSGLTEGCPALADQLRPQQHPSTGRRTHHDRLRARLGYRNRLRRPPLTRSPMPTESSAARSPPASANTPPPTPVCSTVAASSQKTSPASWLNPRLTVPSSAVPAWIPVASPLSSATRFP